MDNENKIIVPKIKICKKCGIDSTVNNFNRVRRICSKCMAKRSNELANEKNYFKQYYDENKDKIKESAMNSYYSKKLNKNV